MIKFWRTTDTYGAFSNFSKHPVQLDDKIWPTSEHFYQAQKTQDPILREQIRECKTPKESKSLAEQLAQLPDNWEYIKYDIMVRVCRAKAEQHASIKELLLSTGDEVIAEDSPKDPVWGLGKDGKGKNLLGKVWMKVRQELRNP